MESYEVHAMDYLLKPYLPDRVNTCIERIYSIGSVKVYLSLQAERKTIRFSTDELIWASSSNHSIAVNLTDHRTFKSYITFDSFTKLLPQNSSFVNCSRGILVNLEYVDYIDQKDFVLTNGTKVPISRSKKQEMQTLFNEYQIQLTRGAAL